MLPRSADGLWRFKRLREVMPLLMPTDLRGAPRLVAAQAHGASRTICGNATLRALCCLTFELSGRQRQDARPGPVKMYSVPPARAWWPAVGAPLERIRRDFPKLVTVRKHQD